MNFKYDNGFEKVFSGTKEKSMGLGSMTFGLETEPREALAMLDFFHASGGIFLDQIVKSVPKALTLDRTWFEKTSC